MVMVLLQLRAQRVVRKDGKVGVALKEKEEPKKNRRGKRLTKLREPAVVLTVRTKDEGVPSYGEVLTRAKTAVNMKELVTVTVKYYVLSPAPELNEVPGADSVSKADALARKLREALPVDTVQVSRTSRRNNIQPNSPTHLCMQANPVPQHRRIPPVHQRAQDAISTEECDSKCEGEGYICIKGECYCTEGYLPNPFLTACVKCPGLGDTCYGLCCSQPGSGSLHCWQGVCQMCYNTFGDWICRDTFDQLLIVSTTQIIISTTLILGIIATFILLFKLCSTSNIRPMGSNSAHDNRLSIGSLQIYVDERLRDAPPRYSTTPISESMPHPVVNYINDGFLHDHSVPPPPYTPENKDGDNQTSAVHI
ncbi:uncharacterized protein ACR2FA_011713 [Aphomia sociella]